MMRFRAVSIVAVGVLVLGLASVALGMKEQARSLQPPASAVGAIPVAEPFLMLQAGDTTWIQIHADDSRCPGDPLSGHGGEAVGGPEGSETYCVEAGVGDSCGTVSPWTNACFKYVDVRTLPSQVGINYWHIDSYRTNQQVYCGSRALWCGADSMYGNPLIPTECGTWINAPGYGEQWNCSAQLSLPASFTVAGGCTLYFDPRYDTECKYDYYYVDYYKGGTGWTTLAMFNATSSNPGGICGTSTGDNPDYWGNTDNNRFLNCNWQPRSTSGVPAFVDTIATADWGTTTSAPMFRWRFTSDGGWDDADGSGNSDGAAWIDNVKVYGDAGSFYAQDFETCSVFGTLPQYWTTPNPDGVAQCWHIQHDPDPPYEGSDGGARTTCLLDSSWVWRARPTGGFPGTKAWRNGWFYRLMTPKIAIQNTGAIVQYDQFMCTLDYTCDYTDTKVRFYDGVTSSWCPWINMDGYILYGGCFFWNFDDYDDVTSWYGSDADSLQMAWDLMDVSSANDVCRGKHAQSDNIVDNVSIGFFDGNGTIFTARGIDILQDSFLEEVDQAYNSFYDAYSSDTLTKYSAPGRPALPKGDQMYLTVSDKDHLASVKLVGTITKGASWVEVNMTLDVPNDPGDPALGGDYYATLTAGDFGGGTDWVVGTEMWYYVRATDNLANVAYFPARANPAHEDHDGSAADYFGMSIMPMFPGTYTGVKILLVDGHNRNLYDWSPCLTVLDEAMPLEDIYEQTLIDAGYCYDKFDISGAGSNQHIHPIEFTDYDAVVWFSGPYFSNYLFDEEAQLAIRDYLADGGKVVLCGDRIAYNMSVVGEDSLGGEFLAGIMGATYQAEMEGSFAKPFVYMNAATTVNVFGSPVAIPLDSVLVYRECPYLKDMSYVVTNTSPPSGYTAQQLLDVVNPGVTYPSTDGAIYVEYNNAGQCVFVNFDLCSTVNHKAVECTGSTPAPAPDFNPGYYYGRVDLMKAILYNLFGLPSVAGGGGTSGVEPKATYKWALSQNSPNPLASGTEIRYEVASTSDVSIKIYNAMGQLVKVLRDGRTEPGRYSVAWDGRNQTGERVSSGVYFYKMEGQQFDATKKMLVVK